MTYDGSLIILLWSTILSLTEKISTAAESLRVAARAADNFALPMSDVCCAQKEKKEMAGQAAERWAESRRACCMCVRKARQRETRGGEGAGHGGQGGAVTSTGGREGGREE